MDDLNQSFENVEKELIVTGIFVFNVVKGFISRF